MTQDSTVFVVEDDLEVRRSISCHLSVKGLNVHSFASAEEFLEAYDENGAGCIVLDMRLRGMSGLDLIHRLSEFDYHDPIIALTGFADVAMAIESLQGGADFFFQKPIDPEKLYHHITLAFGRDIANRDRRSKRDEINLRYESLTPREREVLCYLVTGESSKRIAYRLSLSSRTVEVHRQHIMSKMASPSLVKLCVDLTHHDIIEVAEAQAV